MKLAVPQSGLFRSATYPPRMSAYPIADADRFMRTDLTGACARVMRSRHALHFIDQNIAQNLA